MPKEIRYSEPEGYFPKSIRDKYFKVEKKKQTSGTAKRRTAKTETKTEAKKK